MKDSQQSAISNQQSAFCIQHFDLVPHIDEYFGLWSILERPFRSAVARVNGMDLRAHIDQGLVIRGQGPGDASRESDFEVTADGVAVIPISGVMMKYVSSLSGGTSTVLLRRQIRNAVNNPAVRAIVLLIDSPGGTVSGTSDLAAEVQRANQQKPVYAYIEDLGASAAYWVSSQARRVYSNQTAQVGSIGVYGVIYDLSGAAQQDGIEVHVIRAGKFKGAGEPGTKITEEQLAEWQRQVNELNEFFLSGVATGRRLSIDRVRELADGRVHIGDAAAKLGLSDGVKSYDDTLNELTSQRRTRMSEMTSTNEETVQLEPIKQKTAAASFEDLKICCPQADEKFICAQLERQSTVDQAQSAWMEEQQRRLEALQKELTETKEKQQSAEQKPGVDALGGQADKREPAEDAIGAFNAAVAERIRGGVDRRTAVRQVARSQPELHREYLLATNTGRKVQELIEDRFERV